MRTGASKRACLRILSSQPEPEIALAQDPRQAPSGNGVPQGVVLMENAGYGVNTALREGVTALGLNYAAGIQPQTSVWKQGEGPLPPKSFSGNGRPPKLMRRDKRASAFVCQRACAGFGLAHIDIRAVHRELQSLGEGSGGLEALLGPLGHRPREHLTQDGHVSAGHLCQSVEQAPARGDWTTSSDHLGDERRRG